MQKVKCIGVLSLGKLMGITYALLGLIFVPVLLFVGGMAISQAQGPQKLGGVGIILMALIFPIAYGVMGFVAGVIGAFFYNLASKYVGGLEIELVSAKASLALPE